MKNHTIAGLPEIHTLGRTVFDSEGRLNLFWTASGIAFEFEGTSLTLILSAEFTLFEPWVSFEMDGAQIARFPVRRGGMRITFFRQLSSGTRHRIRIMKEVQAMPEDPGHFLRFDSLEYSGKIYPLSFEKKIEFIGDSITSGEGAAGAVMEQDWIPAFFSSVNNYAVMAADRLNADFRLVSQSGWGIVSGWDNNPQHTLLPFYEEVCGVAAGEQNNLAGAHSAYDFSSWKADAVIISLGTNDACAFDQPEWRNALTGETFKQHLLLDGTPSPADAARIKEAVCRFLETVRKDNPKAAIVWAYGMLGQSLADLLKRAVDAYKRRSGDTRAFFLLLEDTAPENIGARSHPGVRSHAINARILADFLKETL